MRNAMKKVERRVLDEKARHSKVVRFLFYLLVVSVIGVVFLDLFTSIKIHDQLTITWLVGLIILIKVSELIVREKEGNLSNKHLTMNLLLMIILILLTIVFFF